MNYKNVKTYGNKQKEDDMTTIMVSHEVYCWLESKKIHRRQSFNEVLEEIKKKESDRNENV